MLFRFIAALALSACSSIAPNTAAKLAVLDPLAADPAQIEVAVIFPPGLQAAPDSARLEIKAARGARSLAGSFTLDERGEGPGPNAGAGDKMMIYGLAPVDAAQMRDWQAKVALWGGGGQNTTGSLVVAIGACSVDAVPTPDAMCSVLIRLEKTGDFMPLSHDALLSQILGPQIMASIRPCNGRD